jgi:hypothetical protein
MRILFAVFALLTILAGPAAAAGGPVSGEDSAAIQSVISGQIDAFRRDDGPGAFGFAAPSTQGMFGTADTFMQMVRRGYAPVYRPRSVDFAALEEEDGQIVQNVELTGPDGLAYTARYTMEHEADGSWRISGCAILQSRRLGV